MDEPSSLSLLAEDLEEALPHRPPMRWVSRVTQAHAGGGECRVEIRKNAYYSNARGRIRASSYLEWMAQSYAFVKAAQIKLSRENERTRIKTAFLVSIQDAEFMNELGEGAREARVEISNVREVGPLTIFEARIYNESGLLLVQAKLKVFGQT